jgi:hypothetical protein
MRPILFSAAKVQKKLKSMQIKNTTILFFFDSFLQTINNQAQISILFLKKIPNAKYIPF